MAVYFIQADYGGAVKIGLTDDVERRLRQLQCASATPLTLRLVIDGDQKAEVKYHKQFAPAHLRGEWFRPVPELVEFMNRVERACDSRKAYSRGYQTGQSRILEEVTCPACIELQAKTAMEALERQYGPMLLATAGLTPK